MQLLIFKYFPSHISIKIEVCDMYMELCKQVCVFILQDDYAVIFLQANSRSSARYLLNFPPPGPGFIAMKLCSGLLALP